MLWSLPIIEGRIKAMAKSVAIIIGLFAVMAYLFAANVISARLARAISGVIIEAKIW